MKKTLANIFLVSLLTMPLISEAQSPALLSGLGKKWTPFVGVGVIYQANVFNAEVNSSDVDKNLGLSGAGSEISVGFENSATPLYLKVGFVLRSRSWQQCP